MNNKFIEISKRNIQLLLQKEQNKIHTGFTDKIESSKKIENKILDLNKNEN